MKSTMVKVDASTYKIELHDLSVLFLYSSKHPLILPLFLYMLAMTDKNRRGQMARVLGMHPMNSKAIAALFGVGESTIRTTIKIMVRHDLVRYNETTSQRKDGPPVKRRIYTVMLHKLTKKAVDLSKDIARSNKGAVKARRMNLDPDALLRLIDGAFVWVPQVGAPAEHDPQNDENACVRVRTQGNSHSLRPYTDALYTSSSQVPKSQEKLVPSVYSGVTPENTQVFYVTPTPGERHIDVTPNGLSEASVESTNRVTPSGPPVGTENSASAPESAGRHAGEIGQTPQISPQTTPAYPAVASLAKHASNDPLDSILGGVSDEPATTANTQSAQPIGAGAGEPRAGRRLIDQHRLTGKVDPLSFAFEASAANNDTELSQAVAIIRNWGIPDIWEKQLIEFCRLTKLYPSPRNKGQASRSAWVAAMEAMAQDKQTDSFIEGCQISVEKARKGTWTISGPFSVKVDAGEVRRRKLNGDWPGIEEFIRKNYRGGEVDSHVDDAPASEEVIQARPDVVWTITKAQQEQLMKAKLVKDRAVLWKKFLPDAIIEVRGDPNSPVNEYNFVGPKIGSVKVE